MFSREHIRRKTIIDKVVGSTKPNNESNVIFGISSFYLQRISRDRWRKGIGTEHRNQPLNYCMKLSRQSSRLFSHAEHKEMRPIVCESMHQVQYRKLHSIAFDEHKLKWRILFHKRMKRTLKTCWWSVWDYELAKLPLKFVPLVPPTRRDRHTIYLHNRDMETNMTSYSLCLLHGCLSILGYGRIPNYNKDFVELCS